MVEGGRDFAVLGGPARAARAMPRNRGIWWSVGAHGVALAALLVIRGSADSPENAIAPFIVAEIVPLALPATPTESPGAAVAPAAPVAPPTEAPPSASNAPPAAELLPRPAPPPAEAVEPEPAPPPAAPAVESTEPARVAAESESTPPAAQPAAENGERPPEDLRAAVPGQPLAPDEEESLRRRLSSWTGQFTADAAERTLSWRDDGQEYTAVLRPLAAADEMGMQRLAVEVTTQRGGERLVTELHMTRLAFSNFGQFVNRWDPEVGLNDDVIDGRFHSNTAFAIARVGGKSPVFGGQVTVADRNIETSDGSHLNRRRMFPGGIETGVRRIRLPERALTAPSTPNSQRFERDTTLTFYADGSVGWREDAWSANEGKRALGADPFYLIAGEDVALRVQGTVDGKVLVYSPTRIVIVGDLTYAGDPSAAHADDYLGLVTEGAVEIAEPEVTGGGDLDIYASIYAGRRFVVREFRSRRSGLLHVYGSLTAGSLSASEPRYGTHIEFDRRLTTMRAPGFPLSDRYELDSASGEWRVVTTQ